MDRGPSADLSYTLARQVHLWYRARPRRRASWRTGGV